MKQSRAFIPTLRQAPAEAEVVSHKLLIRAGMIRRVANGIYEFLPLGLKGLQKVERVIRDALNLAGCQEVHMPHLVPAELWQESGRWQKYGKELLRIQDRHEREYCFGPTHEEVICDMVRGELRSYRELPLHLYQIQTKFRDEIRPRFGLMRGREFLMKDGYSFHASQADLDREYHLMHETYLKIFAACGLACRAVEADTGAIGGSSSHEFMVLADTGEDVIASCSQCEYAANLEKASFAMPARPLQASDDDMESVETPGKKSVAEVSQFLKLEPARMIKSLVYKADGELVMICLAGDREVNEVKLTHALACDEITLASDDEVLRQLKVPVGFLGPVKQALPLKVIFDCSVLLYGDLATGANKKDCHFVHVNLPRELSWEGDYAHWLRRVVKDISSVKPGDACPKCTGGELALLRGIEVGHIFKLGSRYSLPMRVNYIDEHGKEQNTIMGTYGIGVSRVLAACVEQHHDDKGISWPRSLAPFAVHLITMGPEPELARTAATIYEELCRVGIEVLWDDRDERAGVKFNDADLIGIPLQVLIGRRGLEKSEIEYKVRRDGNKGTIPLAESTTGIQRVLNELP